jgi:heterodisulfide reductase subunit C
MAIRAQYPDSADNHLHDAEICLKCGVCCNVSHSCHVMYDGCFNPRYTFVYDCLRSEKGVENPNIWLCVSCHKCEETCPYDVSPIHLIEALKEYAMKHNTVNPMIKAEINQIISTGYALQITNASERMRESLNLKPVPKHAATDLAKLAAKTGLTKMIKEGQS